MSMHSSKKKDHAALVAHYTPLATLIAELVIPALRPVQDAAFYTQHDAPLKRRLYLAAARRGEFASFCVGRTVFARRADVHAFIERCQRVIERDLGAAATDELEELLESAGIRRPGRHGKDVAR